MNQWIVKPQHVDVNVDMLFISSKPTLQLLSTLANQLNKLAWAVSICLRSRRDER